MSDQKRKEMILKAHFSHVDKVVDMYLYEHCGKQRYMVTYIIDGEEYQSSVHAMKNNCGKQVKQPLLSKRKWNQWRAFADAYNREKQDDT